MAGREYWRTIETVPEEEHVLLYWRFLILPKARQSRQAGCKGLFV